MKVDNAVIMAAGVSGRFAPLSYEIPKGLVAVRGEILIERQIGQLLDAGVPKIYVVTGYKAEKFQYLKDKFDIELVHNEDYLIKDNNSSIWAVRNILRNTYVCSADNYFVHNPFECDVDEAYYAAVYADGHTNEWCMREDAYGYIKAVSVGGENAWYMLGHTFWDKTFTAAYLEILAREYDAPGTARKLWEKILIEHLDILKMKIRKYPIGTIFEFDTLDELRLFDTGYLLDTKSSLLKKIAHDLDTSESDLSHFYPIGNDTLPEGFVFDCPLGRYRYFYESMTLQKIV